MHSIYSLTPLPPVFPQACSSGAAQRHQPSPGRQRGVAAALTRAAGTLRWAALTPPAQIGIYGHVKDRPAVQHHHCHLLFAG